MGETQERWFRWYRKMGRTIFTGARFSNITAHRSTLSIDGVVLRAVHRLASIVDFASMAEVSAAPSFYRASVKAGEVPGTGRINSSSSSLLKDSPKISLPSITSGLRLRSFVNSCRESVRGESRHKF